MSVRCCSDTLRKNKHGKSLKFHDTPCALESQPGALEKKGKQSPVFSVLLGEEGQYSFAAQTSHQNKEDHKPSNNTAAPCALDSLKRRLEDAETIDFVSVLWST